MVAGPSWLKSPDTTLINIALKIKIESYGKHKWDDYDLKLNQVSVYEILEGGVWREVQNVRQGEGTDSTQTSLGRSREGTVSTQASSGMRTRSSKSTSQVTVPKMPTPRQKELLENLSSLLGRKRILKVCNYRAQFL